MDESLKYLNKSVSEHRNPAVAKTIQEVSSGHVIPPCSMCGSVTSSCALQVNKMKAERERLAKIDPERSLKEKEKGNEFFKKGLS